GTNACGPYDDLLSTGPVSIPAGGAYTVTGSRTFSASDPQGSWYSYLTWQDAAGNWHDQTPSVAFQVGVRAPSTVTASGGIDSGSSAWWASESVRVAVTQPVSALRVDVHVARTTGLIYSGMWSTLPGAPTLTHADSPTE